MTKFSMNEHTEEEILEAFFNLPATKFLTVLNAMGDLAKKLEQKGHELADEEEDVVERMIRSLFEDEA